MSILKDWLSAQQKAGICSENQISIPNRMTFKKSWKYSLKEISKLRFLLLIIIAELV